MTDGERWHTVPNLTATLVSDISSKAWARDGGAFYQVSSIYLIHQRSQKIRGKAGPFNVLIHIHTESPDPEEKLYKYWYSESQPVQQWSEIKCKLCSP